MQYKNNLYRGINITIDWMVTSTYLNPSLAFIINHDNIIYDNSMKQILWFKVRYFEGRLVKKFTKRPKDTHL